MKAHSPLVSAAAVFVCLSLVIPPDVSGQAGHRAGQVSRLVPAVNIERGAQQVVAAAQAPVFWADLVKTQPMARARITLDDGSILNVGSDSSLRITQHDPRAQQTELDLTYGSLRSKAVRVARPAGKFEVRTPVGVAGVVGTDFYVHYADGIMRLLVFEGTVRFCNLAGECANVAAGLASSIIGDRQLTPPSPATPVMLTEASQSTDLEQPRTVLHRGSGKWLIFGLVAVGAASAVTIPLVIRRNGNGNDSAGRRPPQDPGPCPHRCP